MTLETDNISPETYQKLVNLSELMIERNNLIEILGAIHRKKARLDEKPVDVLTNKFKSKIALIDKEISRVANGLSCSICQEELSLGDEILVCQWCGSPAHKPRFLKYVKTEGYCPACGEYLKVHFRGSIKTIAQDLFKSCVYAISDKIHKLQIRYGDKLIEDEKQGTKSICPECQRQISADWNFCRFCGAHIEHKGIQKVEMRTCSRCGRQIKSTWKYCKLCGNPVQEN